VLAIDDVEASLRTGLKPRMIEIGATIAKGNKTIDASVAAK
jgi:hypothetical protein